jgi:hypothetical protein
MSVQTANVLYGNELIPYEVLERPVRRTLGIEVHPDGRVLVLAPSQCDEATVEDKVRLRASWISRQLAMFSRYERHTAPRQYLGGESYRYLGRQYKLKVVGNDATAARDQVTLMRGQITVMGPNKFTPEKVKVLLRCWYLSRARDLFEVVLAEAFDTFGRRGLAKPRISVREMRSRWGSLSQGGQMTLNARLIQAPRPCIEYVIVHELCHLVHRNHSRGFFALLGQVLPDWQARKRRLEGALL